MVAWSWRSESVWLCYQPFPSGGRRQPSPSVTQWGLQLWKRLYQWFQRHCSSVTQKQTQQSSKVIHVVSSLAMMLIFLPLLRVIYMETSLFLNKVTGASVWLEPSLNPEMVPVEPRDQWKLWSVVIMKMYNHHGNALMHLRLPVCVSSQQV